VSEPLYLDHAATTPVRDEVAAAMEEARRTAFANPSSPHAAGRLARGVLEDCRERILAGLGGRQGSATTADRLIFTSGATEANHLALLGTAGRGRDGSGNIGRGRDGSGNIGRGRDAPGLIGHSPRDHASIAAAAAELAVGGWEAAVLPLDPRGAIDPTAFAAVAAARPAARRMLLATTLVCGQTGLVEDMGAVASLALAFPGLAIHVDATQAVPVLEITFERLPAATLTIAPHKFGGPRGIGGLLVRGGVAVEPLMPGSQEGGLRGGTEPVALAVGFATALECCNAERARDIERLEALRNRFETRLAAAVGRESARVLPTSAPGPQGLLVLGGDTPAVARAAHISTVILEGIDRQAFVMAADRAGICCATGTACASGSTEPAPAVAAVAAATGLPAAASQSAVRFSFGRGTTTAMIDAAVARLAELVARLAPRC
jgi:cysteine desulfurase